MTDETKTGGRLAPLDPASAEALADKTAAELGLAGWRLDPAHFRAVNLARQKRWHATAHWSREMWCVALAGEVGEVCNALKKLARHDAGLPGNRRAGNRRAGNRGRGNWGSGDGVMGRKGLEIDLGCEIADALIYLDLLAAFDGVPPREERLTVPSAWRLPDAVDAALHLVRCTAALTVPGWTADDAECVRRALGWLAHLTNVQPALMVAAKFNAVSLREGFPERAWLDPVTEDRAHLYWDSLHRLGEGDRP